MNRFQLFALTKREQRVVVVLVLILLLATAAWRWRDLHRPVPALPSSPSPTAAPPEDDAADSANEPR